MATTGRKAPPTPTPAAIWRERAQGAIKTLPSSAVVRVRRPSLFALARIGHVPNPLLEAILPHLVEPSVDEPTTYEQRLQRYRENASTYAHLAALVLAEPRVLLEGAPDYDAGEIAVEDLTTSDLIWIYNYVVNEVELALGGAEDVDTFSQPDGPGGAA